MGDVQSTSSVVFLGIEIMGDWFAMMVVTSSDEGRYVCAVAAPMSCLSISCASAVPVSLLDSDAVTEKISVANGAVPWHCRLKERGEGAE